MKMRIIFNFSMTQGKGSKKRKHRRSFPKSRRTFLKKSRQKTSFSEEKEAKDFLKGQGKEKAYSKTLLPQKPGDTDARLFSFARGSAFISSLGSKNARYGPGVFRLERPFAAGDKPPPYRERGTRFILVGRETPRVFRRAASKPRRGFAMLFSFFAAGASPCPTRRGKSPR